MGGLAATASVVMVGWGSFAAVGITVLVDGQR